MNKLRPENFCDFIGQNNLISLLEIFCKVSVNEKRSLQHCLFYGLPGTGKTSLAFIIAHELKVKIHILNANNIHNQSDLISLFSLIDEHDVVFIDELQSIDPKILEFLYPMMEDFYIDIPLGKEFNKKSTRIKIPNFTLIASTTSIGKIPKPLLDRFQLVYKMENYNEQEIEKILFGVLNKKTEQELLSSHDIKILAKHCKLNPRIAINLLVQVIDFKKVDKTIDIIEILHKLKIYDFGLSITDLEYLKVIKDYNNLLGIKTLVQITGYDSYTIENYIEPFLFKLNLLQKTPRGRILTKKALELLDRIKVQ